MVGKGERQLELVKTNRGIGSELDREVKGLVSVMGELEVGVDLVVEKGIEEGRRVSSHSGRTGI